MARMRGSRSRQRPPKMIGLHHVIKLTRLLQALRGAGELGGRVFQAAQHLRDGAGIVIARRGGGDAKARFDFCRAVGIALQGLDVLGLAVGGRVAGDGSGHVRCAESLGKLLAGKLKDI